MRRLAFVLPLMVLSLAGEASTDFSPQRTRNHKLQMSSLSTEEVVHLKQSAEESTSHESWDSSLSHATPDGSQSVLASAALQGLSEKSYEIIFQALDLDTGLKNFDLRQDKVPDGGLT